MGVTESITREKLLALLEDKARFVRLEAVRLIAIPKNGHYGSTFSAVELFAVLYYHALRVDPKKPDWPDRDRFVLSKGHAAVGLYPILADLGFFPKEALDNFARFGSIFGDHPNMRVMPGIDFSAGSLGHGLSATVGMGLAARVNNRSYRSFCMLGDGELNEGQIWEAAMAAAHFRLGNVIAIVDRNVLGLDGYTEETMAVEPIDKKFTDFGWRAVTIDGHDLGQIIDAMDDLPPPSSDQPTVIIAKTIKGKGVPFMELSRAWHVANLAGADYDEVVQILSARREGK
jgi:transketolase